VTRWADDEWELIAGSSSAVSRADVRVVPLGVLLATDETLSVVPDLAVCEGLTRRDSNAKWKSTTGVPERPSA
jgi:hypothetical protein